MLDLIHKMNQREIPLCLFFNRVNHLAPVSTFFAVISRLGNGVIWYAIMLALPFIYGETGVLASIHMCVIGGVGLVLYKKMKTSTHRLRPYAIDETIFKNVAALDKFSFPSGHTLHAVSFGLTLITYFPELTLLVIPFVILIGLSRLVLGLHYPTDVIMGVIIGLILSLSSFQLMSIL